MTYLTLLLKIPTKDKFDETIEGILKRLEYRHLGEYLDMLEKFNERITSLLKGWLESIDFQRSGITEAVPSISNAVIVIGTTIIVVVLILLIISMRKIVKRNKKVRTILGEVIDENTTKESLKEKASRFRELGEYREALRYSFISLLFQMNEANLLYLDEAKTNSELTTALRKNEFANIDLFEKVTKLFNEVWYGHRVINDEIYESWDNMIQVLENGVYGSENKK